MRFKFSPNQDFQVHAIEAIADVFDGQQRIDRSLEFTLGFAAVPNRLDLDETALLQNLQAIQKRNRVSPDQSLQFIVQEIATAEGRKTAQFLNLSVDMETGTGKTYVYIATIHDLFRRYGMRKFIIVVPSVAVREGVIKTLQITYQHFRELYDNPVYRYYVYDSANLSQIRQFALSDAIEIMVMTIDSFNKASNVIRQSTDRLQGETPIHLVQATRPILILDEPQNMESEGRIAALAALDPLFALRYSATHRNPYNLVYRLSPYDAYRQGLVKRIEVDSIIQDHDANQVFLRLDSVETKGNKVSAKMAIHKLMAGGSIKETVITVKQDDSLEAKSGRHEYAGFEVEEINPVGKFVRFANQVEVQVGEDRGADREILFKAQIKHTITEHFRKQTRLKNDGIKVLSLFFIDRVSNYADEDGIIRRLFNESFNEVKGDFSDWKNVDPVTVQSGYFAQKKKRGGAVEMLDSTSGESTADAEAYNLIMKDKELLLSFPAPDDDEETRQKKSVCFIFSHSALREGWDSPNVFQICTLNQTVSATKKRQEIGRGVRLAVNQDGDRVFEERVNILTVVANESYKNYVKALQSEIAEEYRSEIEARYGKSLDGLTDDDRAKVLEEYGSDILPPAPKRAGAKKGRLRKERVLSDEFKELWDRIREKTRYRVRIDTEKLVSEAVEALNDAVVEPPRILLTRSMVQVSDENALYALQSSGAKSLVNLAGRYPLPNLVDLMSDLMDHTTPAVRLTRRTLLDVYRNVSDAQKQAAMDNPHEFAAVAVRILKEKLADHLVNGIEYEKINEHYAMQQILDQDEIDLFTKHVVETNPDKAVYDTIGCDSGVEANFVRDLEARDDVKLYLKLPRWFMVPTPVGNYNPDWAIVMQEGEGKPILYFVTETKNSANIGEVRPSERRKILCGAAHFGSKKLKKKGVLEGVEYRVVGSASELP